MTVPASEGPCRGRLWGAVGLPSSAEKLQRGTRLLLVVSTLWLVWDMRSVGYWAVSCWSSREGVLVVAMLPYGFGLSSGGRCGRRREVAPGECANPLSEAESPLMRTLLCRSTIAAAATAPISVALRSWADAVVAGAVRSDRGSTSGGTRRPGSGRITSTTGYFGFSATGPGRRACDEAPGTCDVVGTTRSSPLRRGVVRQECPSPDIACCT